MRVRPLKPLTATRTSERTTLQHPIHLPSFIRRPNKPKLGALTSTTFTNNKSSYSSNQTPGPLFRYEIVSWIDLVQFHRSQDNPPKDRLSLDNRETRAMQVVMKLVRVASNRHLRNWDAHDALVQKVIPVAN